MTETIDVPLADGPYHHLDQTFSSLMLRKPLHEHYSELGPVQELQPGPNGGMMIVNYPETVWAYAKRLLVEPSDPRALKALSLEDSMRLEDKVRDFFDGARKRARAPISSPSISDGTAPGSTSSPSTPASDGPDAA